MSPAPERFLLNGRVVDTVLNRIDGQPIDGKHIAVLTALVEAAPNPLSTEELLQNCWPDVVVGDNVVHQAVAHLRKALGDSARRAACIETVPRVGYRLLAKLGRVKRATNRRRVALASAVAILVIVTALLGLVSFWDSDDDPPRVRGTVAVLEIRDLTADSRLDRLAFGIAEELRHQVGNLPDFAALPRVITMTRSTDQVLRFSDLVLDGTIRDDDGVVVVHLELTDSKAGDLLWRETFSGRNDNLLELQRQIATSIVRYFDASLVGTRGPSDPVAYEHYLDYLHHQWGGNADEELRLLQAALEADPEWSEGWMQLGVLLSRFAGWYKDRSFLSPARRASAQARMVSGDPNRTRGLDASLLAYWDADPAHAEQRLRSGADDALHDYVLLMLSSGLCREALVAAERFSNANPYHIGGLDYLAIGRACAGDAAGAVDAALKAIRLLSPDDFLGSIGLIWGLPRLGRAEAGRALEARFERIADNAKGASTRRNIERFRMLFEFELAMADGRIDDATIVAEWFVEQADHGRAGIMLLQLGDARAQFHLAAAGGNQQTLAFHWAWYRPFISPEMRDHPWVRRLEDELGFTLEWRAELCRRASRTPQHWGIACDSGKHELSGSTAKLRQTSGRLQDAAPTGTSR